MSANEAGFFVGDRILGGLDDGAQLFVADLYKQSRDLPASGRVNKLVDVYIFTGKHQLLDVSADRPLRQAAQVCDVFDR